MIADAGGNVIGGTASKRYRATITKGDAQTFFELANAKVGNAGAAVVAGQRLTVRQMAGLLKPFVCEYGGD